MLAVVCQLGLASDRARLPAGMARRRVRMPRNYSLFLEHSSEALRDGISMSAESGQSTEWGGNGETSSDTPCRASPLPSTESVSTQASPWVLGGRPHDSNADAADTALGFGCRQSLGGGDATLDRQSGQWRHSCSRKARHRARPGRALLSHSGDSCKSATSPSRGRRDIAPQLHRQHATEAVASAVATANYSHGAQSAHAMDSTDGLQPTPVNRLSRDEVLEQIVSLVQVAQNTPLRMNTTQPSEKLLSTPACKPRNMTMPCEPQTHAQSDMQRTPNQAECAGSKPVAGAEAPATLREHSWRAMDAQEPLSSPEEEVDEDQWSAEVLLRHAVGERWKVYAKLQDEWDSAAPTDDSSSSEGNETGRHAHAKSSGGGPTGLPVLDSVFDELRERARLMSDAARSAGLDEISASFDSAN